MTRDSNVQNFAGAFNAVHASIAGRLEVGEKHRLDPEFMLPPKVDFEKQRNQLEGVYGELANYDEENHGIKLFFLPPKRLVEFTENPEEDTEKHPKPLVEKFFRDFCGTTVKGLIRIESFSDNWEMGITLGDWGRKKETLGGPRQGNRDQRSPKEREIDEMVATIEDLPASLREQAIDFFPLAYAAMGGMLDRSSELQTTLLTRGNPRLLTRAELDELRQVSSPRPDSVSERGAIQKSIAYGHYIQKGPRGPGGSWQEGEIVISSLRPTQQLQVTPFHKRDVPFELRRRPTFVSHTTKAD